ncbi:hypothetical protein ZWY2020_025984 [Hordeum vulgare]|nr:hypothetical protein ZWY2020_025984 [Hordeum vulgare]
MAPAKRRGGRGRSKTVVRRIKHEDARHVCFSKRRQGFFSKASDLAVLTGAHVAAVAFAPGGTAFSFGHPSVDSVVERFLTGDGPREDVVSDDQKKKLEKLHQVFNNLRAELAEVKKRAELKEEAMAKERAAGDQIAAWVDPNVIDMGDKDMAAFFDVLIQVKDIVSERANQVLLEAWHVGVSCTAPPLPPIPMLFGGSTFELGSSRNAAGMEAQFLVPPPPPPQGQAFVAGMDMQQIVMAALPPPPQGQEFEAGMDMQQIVMAALPPPQELASGSGMDMQQQVVMELPPLPAQVVAAGIDMQEMPPPPEFAAGMDMEQMLMPGFDDEMGMEIHQLLMAMPSSPEIPAGLDTDPLLGSPFPYWEDEIQTRVHPFE